LCETFQGMSFMAMFFPFRLSPFIREATGVPI
jgi:hypothetical protein